MILRRRGIQIALGVLGLALMFQVFLTVWLNPIAERTISQAIPILTDGTYRVDSLDISVGVWNRTVSIRNFALGLVESLGEEELESIQEKAHLVRLEVPEIEIQGLNILRLLFKREFELKQLHFERPYTHLRIPSNAGKRKPGLGNTPPDPDLHNFIAPILNAVYLEAFEWESGQILLEQLGAEQFKPINAKEISLALTEIEIDSTSYERSGRPLYSEKLYFKLDITDYAVVLPDSQYQIQAGELQYANERSYFQIDELRLLPYKNQGANTASPLEIRVPKLVIEGIHPGEILFDRYLGLDSLVLYQPEVRIRPQGNKRVTNSPLVDNPNDLFPLISKVFDDVHLDYFGIRGGSITLAQKQQEGRSQLELDELFLDLLNITIDENTHRKRDRLFCTETIKLGIDSLRYYLPEQGMALQGKNLAFSTAARSLTLSELETLSLASEENPSVSGEMTQLTLLDLDIPTMWFGKKLSFGELRLDNPQITYREVSRKKSISPKKDAKATSDADVTELLETLDIQKITLTKGELDWENLKQTPANTGKVREVELELENFQLRDLDGKELADKVLFDQINFGVAVDDFQFVLPDKSYSIQSPRLGISAVDSIIFIDSLSLLPLLSGNEVPQNIVAYVPKIEVKGWDIKDIFFGKVLHVDSVLLEDPLVRQNHFYQPDSVPSLELTDLNLYAAIEDQFTSLAIHHIGIEDLQPQTVNLSGVKNDTVFAPKLDIRVSDFFLEDSSSMTADRMFFANDIQVFAQPYSLNLPDSSNKLTWKSIGFSTQKKELQIEALELLPISPSNKPSLKISVPQINIANTDVYEMLAERKLALTEVNVLDPYLEVPLSLSLPDANKDSLPPIDLYPAIQPIMDLLSIDSFRVSRGSVSLMNPEEKNRKLTIRDISLNVDGFLLDSLAKARSAKPFYANNIDLSADIPPYSVILPDSSYRIEFRDIGLSTQDSLFYIDSLRLEPLFGSKQDALEVDLILDRLEMKGVDLTEIYFGQTLNLASLHLAKPQILLVVNKEPGGEKQKKKGFDQRTFITQDPYPQLSEVFKYVDIGTVELKEGRLVVSRKERDAIGINNFTVKAHHFRLDSMAYELLDNTYLFSDALTIVLKDFEVPLGDSAMYRLNLGELGLSTRNQFVYANNIQLTPKYGRYEFGAIKGEVVDRWEVSQRRLEIQDLNLRLLLSQQAIRAREIRLKDPRLEIFKDKRYPFPFKRPKMPWEELRNMSTYLHLDSVTVLNGYVFYEEHNEGADTTSWFKLDELDATIKPISNDSFLLMQDPELYLNSSAIVMDEALLNFRASIPYTDTSNYHTIEGDVFELPAHALNPIIEKTANIRAMSGNIHEVHFRFRADNQISRGKMRMRYNDLKVNLLNPKPQKKRGLGRLVGSGLANTFVLHTDNPKRNRFMRVGRIEFEREHNKGFLVYWIKSIVEGIKSSVGISKKEEKELE